MRPELRYVAQLNRLSRALEQAADVAYELDEVDEWDTDGLEMAANNVRSLARAVLQGVAEKGYRLSATKPLVGGAD